MSLSFGKLNASVDTLDLPVFGMNLANGLTLGTLRLGVATGGDFACGSFLGLLAQFPS